MPKKQCLIILIVMISSFAIRVSADTTNKPISLTDTLTPARRLATQSTLIPVTAEPLAPPAGDQQAQPSQPAGGNQEAASPSTPTDSQKAQPNKRNHNRHRQSQSPSPNSQNRHEDTAITVQSRPQYQPQPQTQQNSSSKMGWQGPQSMPPLNPGAHMLTDDDLNAVPESSRYEKAQDPNVDRLHQQFQEDQKAGRKRPRQFDENHYTPPGGHPDDGGSN